MKLKKITIEEYNYKDTFGERVFKNVNISFDPEENELTPSNFDQEKSHYYLPDYEIERMTKDSIHKYLNDNYTKFLKNERLITGEELKGIISFLKVNRSEFAELIGFDKANITKIIKHARTLEKDRHRTILQLVEKELETPGISRILLDKIRNKKNDDSFEELNIDVFKITEYFVRFFDEVEDNITNLKLQKLLYYALGIGFGRYNKKLFSNPVEAWIHGPVVKDVYDRYKDLKASPIEKNLDVNLDEIENNTVVLSILKETIAIYGRLSAWVLRDKTHNESPWCETELFKVITDDKIKSFFKENALV